MDKLEAIVRVFECLYNNQFPHVKVPNNQIDLLVDKTIEIVQKLNKGDEDYVED